jgi:hypothetical protein
MLAVVHYDGISQQPPILYEDSSGFSGLPDLTMRNAYLPGDLEAEVSAFVAHYNHRRYHESLDNLTPADVNFGHGQTILLERERIKRQTIARRRLHHHAQAA